MGKEIFITRYLNIQILPCFGFMVGYDKEDDHIVLLILPFLFILKLGNFRLPKLNKKGKPTSF